MLVRGYGVRGCGLDGTGMWWRFRVAKCSYGAKGRTNGCVCPGLHERIARPHTTVRTRSFSTACGASPGIGCQKGPS